MLYKIDQCKNYNNINAHVNKREKKKKKTKCIKEYTLLQLWGGGGGIGSLRLTARLGFPLQGKVHHTINTEFFCCGKH